MSSLSRLSLALVVLAGSAFAANPKVATDQPIINFRVPDFTPEGNRSWLQNGRRATPVWISGGRYWEIPKTWFNDFVERALETFGRVYVIQPYREQRNARPPA